MINPFKTSTSPISDLYSRARIKSKQNRHCSRSSVQSFRQFQVKVIRTALNNNHIIQKEHQGQHQKNVQRERRRSKYLGIQSQRYQNTQQANYEVKRRDSNYCSAGKQSLMPKEVHFKQRESEKFQNLGNFQGYSIHNVKSHKMMTYSSNYELCNQQKSSKQVLQNRTKIRVSKEFSKGTQRSIDRKCSITNSLDDQNSVVGRHKRGSKRDNPKTKMDQIRQDYFNGYL